MSKKLISKRKSKVLGAGILAASIGLASFAVAQSVTNLRGAEVDEPVATAEIPGTVDRRMQRNYRQQPPLIPHSIDQYQMDLKVNQCLACHDWTKAGERDAPTLSMTHYLDRDGAELDRIAGTRYFCNQCHVPQADALPLVENIFQPSSAD